ncbi:MAG: 3-hydroxyacyl-CoA dehydrogenase family protein [Rhodospirillaceae bacterium]|nr:3-hydroxyacyl-CoA dehydrogenase family protein [Rhodospirillaceae bacterium]
MEIEKVGIIGTGTMGLGMAHVIAKAGIPVVAVKATPGSTDRAQQSLAGDLGKLVDRGKMPAETRDEILAKITLTTSESDVAECDLVIESVKEDLEIKSALFQRLEGIVGPECLLTTNTSTLSVTAMMSVCKERGRVAGLHFFNPAPVMSLVEVIHAFETSNQSVRRLINFCTAIGKEPVLVQDTTGFIVNRLLTPYILDAVRMLERGTGTIDAIDRAMMTGAGYPMGPFALADYIGLDVVYAMASNIYDDVRQQYCSPPHTLQRLVQLGYLGRKTSKGFYSYATKPPSPNPQLRHPVA